MMLESYIKTISKYKIIDQLGQGGMGIVFKAINTENNNVVALKVLSKNSLQDEELKRRFEREANAGMRMNHPNIVKIFEIGEEKGEFFIAMEYVEGETLKQRLRTGSFSFDEVIDTAIAAAAALADAHSKGIIHRDIKSENIMFTSAGDIKVMDFGLAKIQDASILTKEASVLGTISYMSPQQAIGEVIDKRSDIYSLGVVMYELLTKKLPFAGDYEMAVIYSILNEEPLGVREINEAVPKPLEQIVAKALKKDLNQRYQSAEELIEDLKKVKFHLNLVQPEETVEELELVATEEMSRVEERGFTSELVGREEQLENMKLLLNKSVMGNGQTVFVIGEAGIGKTRLTWEFEKHSKTLKCRMLKSQCQLRGSGYPYQPFVDAIRSFFEIKGIEDDQKLMEYVRENAAELENIMPVIRLFLNIKGSSKFVIEGKEQFWDAIFRLILKISAERPLIIFIDDLHWADEDTLNLFYYLSRNIYNSKIMLLGTYRPEDVKQEDEEKVHPLKEIQYEMNRDGILSVIELNRLDSVEIRKMTNSIFKHSEFGDKFFQTLAGETEGNPFYVIETLKLLLAEGIIVKTDKSFSLKNDYDKFSIPSKVHDLVMLRIERLGDEDREILEVGAVEGESFHSGTLMECLGLSKIKLLKKLQSLEREHHIIHPADKMYRFDHAKIREALYDEINPELKVEYHIMIGDYLENTYKGDERMAPNIAWHFLSGNQKGKALPFIMIAAGRAKEVFSNDQAIYFFKKAVEIIEEGEVRTEEPDIIKETAYEGLSDVLALTGKHTESLENYELLKNSVSHSPVKEAELLRKMGSVYASIGRNDYAYNILNTAENKLLSIISYNDNNENIKNEYRNEYDVIRGKIKFTKAVVLKTKGHYEDAQKEIEDGLKLLGEEGNYKDRGIAYNNLGNILYDQGDYSNASRMYSRSLELREKISDKKGIAETYNNLSNVYSNLGDSRRSIDMMEKSLSIMKEIGFRMGIAGLYNNLAATYQDVGKYREAYDMFKTSLKIREEIGDLPGVAVTEANLGYISLDLENYEEAYEHLSKCSKLMQEIDLKYIEPMIKIWLGHALAELNDFEGAKKSVMQALTMSEELNQKASRAFAIRMLSEIELIRIAHANKVEAGNNAFERIEEQLKESLNIFNELKIEQEIGRTDLELAKYYKWKNLLDEAEEFITKAKEIFKRLGATGDIDKADKLFKILKETE